MAALFSITDLNVIAFFHRLGKSLRKDYIIVYTEDCFGGPFYVEKTYGSYITDYSYCSSCRGTDCEYHAFIIGTTIARILIMIAIIDITLENEASFLAESDSAFAMSA